MNATGFDNNGIIYKYLAKQEGIPTYLSKFKPNDFVVIRSGGGAFVVSRIVIINNDCIVLNTALNQNIDLETLYYNESFTHVRLYDMQYIEELCYETNPNFNLIKDARDWMKAIPQDREINRVFCEEYLKYAKRKAKPIIINGKQIGETNDNI